MTDRADLDVFLGSVPRRRRRHWLTLGLLTLTGISVLILFGRFFYGSPSPYYTVPVERGEIAPVLALRGRLHGDGEVTIVAAQDGTVVGLPDPRAAQVYAGQELVVMDTAQLSRTFDADVAAKAQADDAQTRARDALREAAVRLDRYESVWRRSGGRVPSLNEMEGARAALGRARLDVADAATRGEEAERQVTRDRIALSNAAVRAPFDGALLGCQVQPGQIVHAGQPLCTIASHPERLTATVSLGAVDTARLALGASAEVEVDGMGEARFEGKLLRVEAVHGATGIEQVAVFDVHKGEKTPDRPLPLPGRDVTARIALPGRADMVLVPNVALGFRLHDETRKRGTGVYVTDSDGGEARFVPVTLGGTDGRHSEVLSGELKPGERVIIGWRREGGTAPAGYGL
ncbi:biotin/lipoyl attachment domain-containing protein [Novosphingobium nitrogenifigens DSM 19370]|uniref:Biotin/lipoyl attachment domain-containing protein n=1 Tax=Novosphingobium nitrogenifigens DSM 19370 TaxID=983920 RepID=F1ZB17_9SPHN|nr:efflux RND transporter periplasmic adaptor subunit [Novosphingobium nitrogenifigens]EGD58116.1 biotin/lipoyl attachment domain-containing protein [Novosphingobium nitrogenifigens DSM 19370]